MPRSVGVVACASWFHGTISKPKKNVNTDTLPVRLNLKKLQSLAILAMGFWIFGNETEALADVTLEAHNLAVTSSPSGLTSVQASSSATDGSWVQLASTATGQYME